MKQSKIKVLTATTNSMNESGEEEVEYTDEDKYIVGVISPMSVSRLVSKDQFAEERTSNTEMITVYSKRLYPWLKADDRLLIDGKTFLIEGAPLVWNNSRGYKNLTIVSAVYVEG
jgi:hypothetical protein